MGILKKRAEQRVKYENETKEKYLHYNELFNIIPTFRSFYSIENGSSISFESIKNKQFDLFSIEKAIENNVPKNSFIAKEETEHEVVFNELFKEGFPPTYRRKFNSKVFQKASEFFRSFDMNLNYLEEKFTSKGMHRSEGTTYYIHLDYLNEPYLFRIERFESASNDRNWILYLIATNEDNLGHRSYAMERLIFWFKHHSPERLTNVLHNRAIQISHLSFPYINDSLKKHVNTCHGGVPISGTKQLKDQGYETVFDLLELTIQEFDEIIKNQYRFIQTYFWVKEAGLSFKNELDLQCDKMYLS